MEIKTALIRHWTGVFITIPLKNPCVNNSYWRVREQRWHDQGVIHDPQHVRGQWWIPRSQGYTARGSDLLNNLSAFINLLQIAEEQDNEAMLSGQSGLHLPCVGTLYPKSRGADPGDVKDPL